MREEIKVGKFTLQLDTEDPHTPAIIEHESGTTATYDCAMDTGELETHNGTVIKIDDRTWAALDKYRDKVEEAFNIARPDGWNG